LRKILFLLLITFILSGCATYKFKKSGPSATPGYLVTYDDESILEYTVGKDNTLPDMELAKERFKRRRSTVEYYYKKMGLIEPRLKEVFWDPAAMFVDFLWGIFRWPYTAITDYKYNRDPKYKERIDKLDEQKDALEKARVGSLKQKLDAYVAADLAKESPAQEVVEIVPPAPVVTPETVSQVAPTPEVLALVVQEPAPVAPAPVETKSVVKATPVVKKAPIVKPSEPPVAVIIANPAKGYSPLKVSFSGQKSYAKSGKIVSYLWDFGDGDTSTKKNPDNVYWSTTYGLRTFTATLTVKDSNGLTSSATTTIEISTP